MAESTPPPDDAMRRLQEFLEGHGYDLATMKNVLEVIHPADLAYLIEDLGLEEKIKLFEMLGPEIAATVLSEVDPRTQAELVEHADRGKVSEAVGKMEPDDTADLLERAAPGQEATLLQNVDARHAEQVRQLMQFAPGTAGGRMTSNIVRVRDDMTAGDALGAIQGSVEAEMLESIFVTDPDGRFRGVLSLRSLLRAAKPTPVATLMDPHVSTCRPDERQEAAARIVAREDIAALPVVDEAGMLLGVITHDDVIDVIQEEAIEDLFKIAGTGGEVSARDPVLKRVFVRLPWLLPTMCGSMLVGWLMNHFSGPLGARFAVVSCFIPIMMATGGNVGLQCSTLMVRGLATGEVGPGRVMRTLFAESRVGFTIGLICGLLTGLSAHLFNSDLALGAIVMVSMWVGVSVAATAGTLLPIICTRVGVDPAISAGPFITALNDLTATVIYLSIAQAILT